MWPCGELPQGRKLSFHHNKGHSAEQTLAILKGLDRSGAAEGS